MSVRSSPLRFFLAFAGVVVVGFGASLRAARDDGSVIVVDPEIVEGIVARQEELSGRALTEAERASAVEGFLEEEMLVREAFRRGLDRNDRRVRPMLRDHAARELLRAAGYQPPSPSDEELRAFFESRRDTYTLPERVDLQQVFFVEGAVPENLESILEELRGGADFTSFGAAGPGASVRAVTRADLTRAYGLELATTVYDQPEGEWRGPFVSRAGTHFVRLGTRTPARALAYEEVAQYLAEDYLRDDRSRALEAELERLRRRYVVEVPDGD